MVVYIIRRVFAMIPALLGISLITFVLMHSTKGGPFTTEHSDAAITAALEQAYHLDEPLWPTFFGNGASTSQGIVLVLGLLLAAGGGALIYRSRARRAASLSVLQNGAQHSSAFGAQQLSSMLVALGGALIFWWVVMFFQGQPTRLGGSGFTGGQYLRFLWNLLHFDLGPSFNQKGRNVTDIIVPAAGNSFILGMTAFALLVLVAVPLGIVAALKQNTWIDYAASTFSLIGYSIPNFVLGILLILVVGLNLGWLPIAGWDGPQYLVLPALVLAIRPMAVLTRLTRASMLEVLNQDYIRTAWAKGLGNRVVVIRHALRNALLPVVTVMGDQFGDLVTGSLVVESLYAVPGIGSSFVDSVNQRDYSMIMGTTIFYATLVLIINLIVDLMYGVIDPRVRLGAAARS
ncbi:MAG: ABC transporter permease [Chloroflexota bacterium]|nr:ABC transporter permease [Chloroflexota bacterium]